jgi:hypothetical protein
MLRHLAKVPGVRRLWSRFPVGSVDLRTEYDIWDRPAYAYGIHSAAKLARALGLDRITAVEFGVAGGNGLVSMERIAEAVGGHLGVDVAVIGFDAGSGMPAPEDYRDLPPVWAQGFYKMDAAALRARLRKAELVLGNVADTVRATVAREGLPPIGFVSFDLDYYSSTMSAFHIFGGGARTRLPRVYCYFDDLTWPERACHNEYVGELCAIREFNEMHPRRKIAQLPNLRWMRARAALWNEQTYVFHDFDHPLYTRLITPEGDEHRELRLG